MALDKRDDKFLIFIGESSIPRRVIEEGDEATLYDDGNLIMVNITAVDENQMKGIITRSVYDPDLQMQYASDKEIHFSKENIFGISRKKRDTYNKY